MALRLKGGKPSALGKKLLHLICPGSKPLTDCHCVKMVFGFWHAQLTIPIRSAMAGQTFDKDTYKALFTLADQVWVANGGGRGSYNQNQYSTQNRNQNNSNRGQNPKPPQREPVTRMGLPMSPAPAICLRVGVLHIAATP